jgi:hypothetical protein
MASSIHFVVLVLYPVIVCHYMLCATGYSTGVLYSLSVISVPFSPLDIHCSGLLYYDCHVV